MHCRHAITPALVRELNQGAMPRSRLSIQAVAIVLFLTLAGLAMAISLIAVQTSTTASSGKDQAANMTSAPTNGIISRCSNHSVDETVERLKTILQSKGVTLFAIVDHSGKAEKAGMKMLATN
jgi:hypothetical protein